MSRFGSQRSKFSVALLVKENKAFRDPCSGLMHGYSSNNNVFLICKVVSQFPARCSSVATDCSNNVHSSSSHEIHQDSAHRNAAKFNELLDLEGCSRIVT